MTVVGFFACGPLLLLFGVMDAVITILLLVATSLRSGYIPESGSRCSHLPTDHDFNKTLSFYELAGSGQWEETCKRFYMQWAFGVGVT